jgi:3-mercaptopyruvate sulfurtransferase SseA
MLKKIILNSLKVGVVGYILITTFSSNGYQVIDQDTAYKQLQDDNSIHLIDVRDLHEFNAGHIDGAQLIPLGTIERYKNIYLL